MHAAVILPLRFFIFPILLILSSFCTAHSFSDEERLFSLEDSNPHHKISSSADQSEVHQYPPEVVSRRDFLVRALQQRQPKAVLLARHRVLRPYFQPVPKAKAIPGPILLRTPKAIPKVKGGESLLRVQVNAQSTAGLIKRAEQIRRLQLVNGGGDGSGSSNSEDDAGRESEELEMISNEVQQQEEDHVSTPKETSKGQSLLAKQNRTQQQPVKAFSSAVKPSLAFSLDSDPVQQQQQKGRPTTFGQPQKWAQPNVGVGKGSQVQRKVAKIGQAGGQIPPLNQQQKLQFFYSPSQTVVNQDFTFAADTPGLVCAYGMPVPIYNTPRKQCIPHSPFCGLAFTCVMDVHAADQQGRPVDNWWTKGSDGKQQPPQWQPGTHQAQGQQTAIVHGPAGQRIGQGVGPAAFTGQFGQQNLRIGR